MTFKAIFWDNDGTLVNTEPAFFRATRRVLATVGIELTEEWNANESLKRGRSAFDLARASGVSDLRIQELRQTRNEIYLDELRTHIEILPQVLSTLENLKGKVAMGVVTTTLRAHFELIMAASGLGKYFDFSVCYEDVTNGKPHPEPYLKAMEISGFKKEDCLVIEDTERGVTAAKAAGLTCFACPTEFSKSNDFSHADKVIKDVSEVLSYFT